MRHDREDLKKLAAFLDSSIRLPFGMRVGWDGIIGLIPGLGDLLTTGMSGYIILRAAQLGAPASVILRMGLNVLVDNVVDLLPFLGWVLDFAWKSNLRNVRLLEKYYENPRATVRQSSVLLVVVLTVLFAMAAGTALLAGWVSWWAFRTLHDLWATSFGG